MSSLLESYLDFFYAKEILNQLPEVIRQRCGGCQRESLSQIGHIYVTINTIEQISCCFEDILKIINEQDILLKWRDAAVVLVSSEYLAIYQLKLNSVDWRETMKTFVWKRRVIKLCKQLLSLEKYF